MKRSRGMSSVVAAAALVLAAWGGQVQAQEASSNGYAISASLSLLGGAGTSLTVAPKAPVGFAAQTSGFADDGYLIDFSDASTGGLLTVSTGELRSATQYVAPAAPHGFAVVGTQASAAGVDVGAVSVLGGSSLLGITANLLTSHAIVSGYCPPQLAMARQTNALAGIADNFVFNNGFDEQTLQASGGSDGFDDNGSPGVTVEVAGAGLITVPLNPDANTGINLGSLGSLIINEQNFTGDGISSRGMASNALHLTLNTGVLNAEVVIAHSEASLTCP